MNETDELLERLRSRRSLPPPAMRRQTRLAAGASLREVAVACGVSWSAVAAWEAGSTPRGETLELYADVLRRLQELDS